MTIQSKKFKLAILILTTALTGLILTSCKKEEIDKTTAYGKARSDVTMIKHEVHAEYLNCYPLAPSQKKACAEKIAEKYLKPHFKNEYKVYRETFQHESEKLGFKLFLTSKGLACGSLKNGPIFDHKEDAYLVVCSAKNRYYMQFDYDKKQWTIKGHADEF